MEGTVGDLPLIAMPTVSDMYALSGDAPMGFWVAIEKDYDIHADSVSVFGMTDAPNCIELTSVPEYLSDYAVRTIPMIDLSIQAPETVHIDYISLINTMLNSIDITTENADKVAEDVEFAIHAKIDIVIDSYYEPQEVLFWVSLNLELLTESSPSLKRVTSKAGSVIKTILGMTGSQDSDGEDHAERELVKLKEMLSAYIEDTVLELLDS
jgi:hypothetical protein